MKAWLALLLLAAVPAGAVRPEASGRDDARRFGLNRLTRVQRATPSAESRRAFSSFNSGQGGKWAVTYSPRTGLPDTLFGGRDWARQGRPDDAARSFLSAHKDFLGVDPATLTLERETGLPGHKHLLYRQTYHGIPVEAAAVKVHMDDGGSVLAVHSSYEPSKTIPTTPNVPADAAARAAAADAGAGATARGTPTLVILPLESDGVAHLAWKLRVDGGGGSWRYFVDALTGQVLFRYSVNRFIGPCLSSGVVTGMVYDIDPSSTPGPVSRPFNNQFVYLSQPPVRTTTLIDSTFGGGFFCSATPGKVSMSLQGPYVSVSEFRGRNAHYDNGNGVWSVVGSPLSSPHPYANSSVFGSTIDLSVAAPNAVEFMPVFTNFSVGNFDGGSGEGSGDIIDDDQLFIYDGSDNPVAAYVGNRGPFNGASIHGSKLHMALKSNDSGVANGFDIAFSSYLTLTNPSTDGAPLSSHTWTAADTSVNLTSEINLFYHLNQMHDYFLADVNKSSAAPITRPVVAMAHVGPNLLNAFYDPDYDDLMFGDVSGISPSDAFTLDATVPHHEYVHYVVEKIWSIQNYGQAGAISEANADYFSASSLNDSSIGSFVLGAIGGAGVPPNNALRELDCHRPGANPCFVLGTTSWNGEIHDDSPFVSQALWEIRQANIARLGSYANGRSCADGLEFQSLLFFPESFTELYQDMLTVDHLGLVAACGGANASQAIITSAFGAHGLTPVAGDAYEPNDGFETAVDISTLAAVSATIYPAADTDFYSFGAGAGLVQISLALPSAGNRVYKAYQLKLYDSGRHMVASAAPPYNGFGTIDGICSNTDCDTTQASVNLSYNNPTGGLLYVQVIGGDALNGSNSGVNSTSPYGLVVTFPKSAALSGSIVSARFDNDTIGFTVNTSTFVSTQDWKFAYAQLRDQGFVALPNTLTHLPALGTDFVTFGSSQSSFGTITGTVKLVPGYAARFPASGTVYLEVFAYDVHGSTNSMGLSNPINLSAGSPELTAYNNVFNPTTGGKATVKYAVSGPGRLSIKLYTVTGRYVTTLFEGDAPAGKGSIDWAGVNASGATVASGVYVVRAVGPGLNDTQKIVVVK